MTTAPTSHARRRAALLAVAASAGLVLSGCSVNSPAATTLTYAPADGVQADGTEIGVRDLLVVSQGNGAPAVVSGAVLNLTDEPVTVAITAAGTSLSPEVTVEPNSSLRLDGTSADGTPGEPLTMPALDTPAGVNVEVRLSTGSETLSADTPVLLPQGPYEQFADDAGGTVEPHADHEDDEDH